jgi:hypothetical protein
MYNNGSVEKLSVETVAWGGICQIMPLNFQRIFYYYLKICNKYFL